MERRQVLGGIAAPGSASPARAAPGKRFGHAVAGFGYYGWRQIMPNVTGCDHARVMAMVEPASPSEGHVMPVRKDGVVTPGALPPLRRDQSADHRHVGVKP